MQRDLIVQPRFIKCRNTTDMEKQMIALPTGPHYLLASSNVQNLQSRYEQLAVCALVEHQAVWGPLVLNLLLVSSRTLMKRERVSQHV